jgi:hypothetical protein
MYLLQTYQLKATQNYPSVLVFAMLRHCLEQVFVFLPFEIDAMPSLSHERLTTREVDKIATNVCFNRPHSSASCSIGPPSPGYVIAPFRESRQSKGFEVLVYLTTMTYKA